MRDASVPTAVPVAARLKAPSVTPVTFSEKFTVKLSVAALLGLLPTVRMDDATGAVWSTVYAGPLVYPPAVTLPVESTTVLTALRSRRMVPSPPAGLTSTV